VTDDHFAAAAGNGALQKALQQAHAGRRTGAHGAGGTSPNGATCEVVRENAAPCNGNGAASMGHTGLEPAPPSRDVSPGQDDHLGEVGGGDARPGAAESGAVATRPGEDYDLGLVIREWPTLHEQLRAALVAMVGAAGRRD